MRKYSIKQLAEAKQLINEGKKNPEITAVTSIPGDRLSCMRYCLKKQQNAPISLKALAGKVLDRKQQDDSAVLQASSSFALNVQKIKEREEQIITQRNFIGELQHKIEILEYEILQSGRAQIEWKEQKEYLEAELKKQVAATLKSEQLATTFNEKYQQQQLFVAELAYKIDQADKHITVLYNRIGETKND